MMRQNTTGKLKINKKGKKKKDVKEKPKSGKPDSEPVSGELGKRIPEPGTVRNLVHVGS